MLVQCALTVRNEPNRTINMTHSVHRARCPDSSDASALIKILIINSQPLHAAPRSSLQTLCGYSCDLCSVQKLPLQVSLWRTPMCDWRRPAHTNCSVPPPLYTTVHTAQSSLQKAALSDRHAGRAGPYKARHSGTSEWLEHLR